MDAAENRKISYWVISAIAVYLFLFVLPAAIMQPDCDSGIFIYCGSRAAAGAVPYVDFWDHKGPLIFYINAVAALLTPRSMEGSALIQYLFLVGAFWCCWQTLKRAFGFAPALGGTLAVLPLLAVADSKYNFTEIYALLFQFGAIYCFYISESPENKARAALLRILLGVLMGCAFMLRPNLVSVGGAIGLTWIITGVTLKEYKGLWSRIWQSATGYALVWAVFSIYFLLNHAFMDFLDGMIFFNTAASETSWITGLNVIRLGIIATLPVSLFAFAAWIAEIYKNRYHKLYDKPLEPLVLMAIFYMPVEIISSILSGRPHGHYFLAWLPPMALLVATGLKTLFANPAFQRSKFSWINGRGGLVMLLIGLALLPQTWSIAANTFHHVRAGKPAPGRLIEFITDNSVPEDNVLVCSYLAGGIYYLAGRQAPSKYLVQFNFWMGSDKHWTRMNKEFLADIRNKRPKYIIWLKNNSKIRKQVQMAVQDAGSKYSYSSTVLPGAHVFIRKDGSNLKKKPVNAQ